MKCMRSSSFICTYNYSAKYNLIRLEHHLEDREIVGIFQYSLLPYHPRIHLLTLLLSSSAADEKNEGSFQEQRGQQSGSPRMRVVRSMLVAILS